MSHGVANDELGISVRGSRSTKALNALNMKSNRSHGSKGLITGSLRLRLFPSSPSQNNTLDGNQSCSNVLLISDLVTKLEALDNT